MFARRGTRCWRPVPSATRKLQQEGGNVDKGLIWRDGLARAEMKVAFGELYLKVETKRPPLPRDPLPQEIISNSPRVPFSLDTGAERVPQGASSVTPPPSVGSGETNSCSAKWQNVWPALICLRQWQDDGVRQTEGFIGSWWETWWATGCTQWPNNWDQVLRRPLHFSIVLSTRAGSECIADVIQGLTELNPEAAAMMDALN